MRRACHRRTMPFIGSEPPIHSMPLKLRNKILGLCLVTTFSLMGSNSVRALEAPSATVTNGEQLVWKTDYAAALNQAKAENRRVFLFFTGSDWCSWCARLNKEILSTPEFARYSKEKLILVEVDFPKKRPQSASLKAQNAKLFKRYKIEGYPTVIVLDSGGKKIDELGYQEGGPAPFISRLGKL
jgi:thioredoxin-related protein